MTTSYGKALRKIRIDHDEILRDMATKLGITSAYLSAIENGKRSVPTDLTMQVSEIYKLSPTDKLKLEEAEDAIKTNVTIELSEVGEDRKNMVLKLARQFSDLTNEQLDEIQKILK
nr:MAG TPA: helix-turn-helix domain protein [Caudoviricetes sp.]